MKKNLILLVIFTRLFSQSEHPYPPLNLISIPTGGTMPRGSYTFEILLQNNGGLLPEIAVGLTEHFTIGISYGLKNLIGDLKPAVNRSKPEVNLKYRLYEETLTWPALVIGLDTQGRGVYQDSVYAGSNNGGIEKLVNRYDQKAWGLFLVMSKNYNLFGNLGLHLGVNKNAWEIKDNDKDMNLFFGFDKEINRSFSLLVEYDAAWNDNSFNNSLEIVNPNENNVSDITFGKGRGYLNAAFRWTIANNLLLEIDFNNISRNTSAEYTNREIKIMYSEKF